MGYTEESYVWDSIEESEKFFHSFDFPLENIKEIKIEYFGKMYDDSMSLKDWCKYSIEYNEVNNMNKRANEGARIVVDPSSWH